MDEQKSLKRAVVKEELIAITKTKSKSGKETNDVYTAIILNQFIYWSERTNSFHDYISEENKLAKRENNDEPYELEYGWIYKSAQELAEETMLDLSKSNMLAHIKRLIDLGFLNQRNNPKYHWDRTYQYRVNMVAVAKALLNAGYDKIDGCGIGFSKEYTISKSLLANSKTVLSDSNIIYVDAELEQLYHILLTITKDTKNITDISSERDRNTSYFSSKEKEKREKEKEREKDRNFCSYSEIAVPKDAKLTDEIF